MTARVWAIVAVAVLGAATVIGLTVRLHHEPRHGAAATCTTTVTPSTDFVGAINSGAPDTVVCFAAGTYRITRSLSPKAGQTLRGEPGAILSGARVLRGWTASGTAWVARGSLPPAYTDGGVCEDLVRDDCRLAESLHLDGETLDRAPDRQSVTASSYYADYANNAIYLSARPTGVAELARTRTAIISSAPRVTVEGFTVEGFASLYQRGAIMVCGPDWTVRDNRVTWNHNVGIQLAKADRATIANNTVFDNGETGISQWRSTGVTIRANVISGNNTGGYWIADGQSGGIKLARSGAQIIENTVRANRGVGVWADSYSNAVTIARNDIVDNWADGVRFEISRNGLIGHNTIGSNALRLGRSSGSTLFSGGGIDIANSADVTVTGNSLRANLNEIAVQDRNRSADTDPSYHVRGIVISANHVDLRNSGGQLGVVASAGLAVSTDPSHVAFDHNSYLVGDSDPVFVVKSQNLTFQQWQLSGRDRNGAVEQ